MFPARPRFRRLATVALFLSVLLSSTYLSESQNSIVCNEGRHVSVDSDGNLEYDPLPGTNPPDVEEYNAGGLAGWYSLARGFVDAVQPENLPYGKQHAKVCLYFSHYAQLDNICWLCVCCVQNFQKPGLSDLVSRKPVNK